jgi:DNA polymerase
MNAADLIPPRLSLRSLNKAAKGCTACPLYAQATQTVFGEGPSHAAIMLIGQIPGDEEDRKGHPFVGPAGRLLDRCLQTAGISRDEVYITNTVKHFKWAAGSRHRIGKPPNNREIAACRPWLDAELKLVKPRVIICLGATAAQALLGKDFRVSRDRGEWHSYGEDARILATVHPSSLLRMPRDREAEIAAFTADLKKAASGVHARKTASI